MGGGHQYMHNPDTFGFLQFAGSDGTGAAICRNVEWPIRFLLAEIYQAQVQYVISKGVYASLLEDLMGNFTDPKSNKSVPFCNMPNGCYLRDIRLIKDNPTELVLRIDVDNDASTCVKYTSPSAVTGGRCFKATLSYMTPGNLKISGSIKENRYMQVDPHDRTLCLLVDGESESEQVPWYA